jgi:hypothetical protein
MMQAELIIWIDPFVLDRPWNNDEEIEEKTDRDMTCHTVGYVAKETETFVVLAQGFTMTQKGDEVEEWGHCWVIPKICILSRENLHLINATPQQPDEIYPHNKFYELSN